MTANDEIGLIAALTAMFAAILKEQSPEARARMEADARREVASLPMELLAPSMDAAKVRDSAQRFLNQIFKVSEG